MYSGVRTQRNAKGLFGTGPFSENYNSTISRRRLVLDCLLKLAGTFIASHMVSGMLARIAKLKYAQFFVHNLDREFYGQKMQASDV